MATFKSSVSIEATPQKVSEYLDEAAHLAAFVAVVEPGETPAGNQWFTVIDAHRHRVDWEWGGAEGWFEVDPEGRVASVTAEVRISATDEDARLDRALFALKEAIEAG